MAKNELDTRFSKFGTISFASVTKVNDFIGYLDDGKVEGTKCKKCGKLFFPPRAQCFSCLSSDMEWFPVSGAGQLLSFSTLKFAPTGFGDDLPYTIALLDYGDYKVFGRIDKSIPESDLVVGMKMQTKVGQTSNGQLTYMFVKA
jgi:hypothetical protein